MSDHKLFTCAQVLCSIQLPLTQAEPFRGVPPRGTRHLLLLTRVQRAADAAATSKAPEGPLKDPGLSQSIYFHRFGKRQTSPHHIVRTHVFWERQRATHPTSTYRLAPQYSKKTPPGSAWTLVRAPSQRQQVTAEASVCYHGCSAGMITRWPNSD